MKQDAVQIVGATSKAISMGANGGPIDAYYYNPIDDIIKQTAVNAFADGSFDVAQSYLYLSPSHSTPANGGIVSSTGTASNRNGRTYEYAHKKVGRLLGIV